ncbi:MAG TPA: hypothetical protein PKE62_04955 [Anaerolineales bacterium]|nr:hypothetical protein [Anaerolineales bacterium]
MKRILFVLILILILSACASAVKPTQQSLFPGDDGQITPTPQTDLTPAEQAAVSHLSATLNLPPEAVSVIFAEAVEWPDGCLGVQQPGVMCTEAIVPGYRIILQAGDEQYELHTNKNGSQIAQVGGALFGLVEESAAAQLASNLGLKANEVVVVSSKDVEFPNSCLGVTMQDVLCAEVITPGKIIVLKANGLEFEYHASEDGSSVQPATLALTWTRDGGIAGFCDKLTVFLSGEAYGSNCRSKQPEAAMKTFGDLLTATEQKQFFAWVAEYGQVSLDISDPVMAADRMVVTLEFFGVGGDQPTSVDEQVMIEFAQSLYANLFP